MFNRESVISSSRDDPPIEIVQYRRRHSLVFEEGKALEPVKEDEFEDVRLSDDLSQKGNNGKSVNGTGTQLGRNSKSRPPESPSLGAALAPDGGYGWVIVFCSFCLNFIVDGITLTEGQLHDPLRKAANNEISVAQVSWINGCLTGVTLLVGPLASLLVDRFGFRFTVITGGVIAALGILLSWAASPHTPNIYYLVIFYGIVAGIGFGLVFSPSVVIVTHYFESKRALATGIAVCGTGVGTLVMAQLGEMLIQGLDWNGTIPVQAAIVLLCVVFGAFLIQPPTVPPLRKLFNHSGKNEPTTKRRPSVVLSVSSKIAASMRTFVPFFLSPTYMILAISGATTMLGFFSPFAFVPGRSGQQYQTKDEGKVCLVTMGVFNVVARVVFGFLSDRPWTNNLAMSNTALTVAGLATGFSYLIDSYELFVAYCGLFGLCIGCFATLRSILILEFIGLEKMNDGFGLSLVFMGIPSLFSAPIAGYLIEMSGERFDLAFQVAGFFIGASALMCYPLRYVAAWEKTWKTAE